MPRAPSSVSTCPTTESRLAAPRQFLRNVECWNLWETLLHGCTFPCARGWWSVAFAILAASAVLAGCETMAVSALNGAASEIAGRDCSLERLFTRDPICIERPEPVAVPRTVNASWRDHTAAGHPHAPVSARAILQEPCGVSCFIPSNIRGGRRGCGAGSIARASAVIHGRRWYVVSGWCGRDGGCGPA